MPAWYRALLALIVVGTCVLAIHIGTRDPQCRYVPTNPAKIACEENTQ